MSLFTSHFHRNGFISASEGKTPAGLPLDNAKPAFHKLPNTPSCWPLLSRATPASIAEYPLKNWRKTWASVWAPSTPVVPLYDIHYTNRAITIMTTGIDQLIHLPRDASNQSYIRLSVFPRIRIATRTFSIHFSLLLFRHYVNKQLRGHR